MKNKISFMRVETMDNKSVAVKFFPREHRKMRIYKSPSEDSIYRLLNNSMVSDIYALVTPFGLSLEITPKY
jgi:hypothetical protein